MEDKKRIVVWSFVAIVLVSLTVFYLVNDYREFTSDECWEKGGRIVNTLNGEGCRQNETSISKVDDMRCKCICCVPEESS